MVNNVEFYLFYIIDLICFYKHSASNIRKSKISEEIMNSQLEEIYESVIKRGEKLKIPKGGWKFDTLSNNAYDKVIKISNATKQFSIMCAYFTFRRQKQEALEKAKNKSKNEQLEKLDNDEVETNPPSPIKRNHKKIKLKIEEQIEKNKNSTEENQQKDKFLIKGKNQKENIKRWKQEKAQFRKSLSEYRPESQPIKIAYESTKSLNEITRHTIARLYEVIRYSDLIEKVYVKEPEEDPFFLEAYKVVFHLVKVDLIYPPQEVNLAKIKTFVVRRVLDDFVISKNIHLTADDKNHLNQIKRRMTKRDRTFYENAGIAIPNSRIEKDYLLSLFVNLNFRQYYRHYVQSEKLIVYLRTMIIDQIMLFQQEIFRIQNQELPLQKKIQSLKRISKRPIVAANIQQYQNEAKMVMLQYGQDRS